TGLFGSLAGRGRMAAWKRTPIGRLCRTARILARSMRIFPFATRCCTSSCRSASPYWSTSAICWSSGNATMCGRFTLRTPAQQVADAFDLQGTFDFKPRYNVAPSQMVTCVQLDGAGKRQLVQLKWGLVPSWSKDAKVGYKMINARSDG